MSPIFSEGIRKHPDDPRMYRHRGARYINVREFERAIDDLDRAEELTRGKADEEEPEGVPNPRGARPPTLQASICYYSGLARYMKGDFESSLPIWRRCVAQSTTNDTTLSASFWLYMTLLKLERREEAEQVLLTIGPDFHAVGNTVFEQLMNVFADRVPPEKLLGAADPSTEIGPTVFYGVGNWYLSTGQRERGMELIRAAADAPVWSAFGAIAAEAELARQSTPRDGQ